ncbi:hypothetical protein HRR83_002657 [Exophiala dermatitidis]|uniref:Uncharacterized protein n=1 Tax=Exophiala dermatitidis TaxID=5970 RepID=A0AAN6EK28_EXODE|nr:hypothetical protein HRR74_009276 [Exophiala dermatitidis]KAJ4514571.1 hypothetical protein HRR73_005599 [Exophiala dermatitidis]KAJ4531810.1 hypothetical protein HRR77_009086 [Exophiala dermatitidis]KAJ4537430.1 hypothetical protein HRR76_005433 [Exophiala dermatitidis]KAJ4566170.1 hypothetical protein HRR79_005193 [Exophiala dermatitidis]
MQAILVSLVPSFCKRPSKESPLGSIARHVKLSSFASLELQEYEQDRSISSAHAEDNQEAQDRDELRSGGGEYIARLVWRTRGQQCHEQGDQRRNCSELYLLRLEAI